MSAHDNGANDGNPKLYRDGDTFPAQGRMVFVTDQGMLDLDEVAKYRGVDRAGALAWCIRQGWHRLGFITNKRRSDGLFGAWRSRPAVPNTAGEVLVRYRRLAEKTRAQMAVTLGVTMPALAHYETGRRGVKLDILRKAKAAAEFNLNGNPDIDPETGLSIGLDLTLFAGDRRAVEARAVWAAPEDPERVALEERAAAMRRRRSAIAAMKRRRPEMNKYAAKETLLIMPVDPKVLAETDREAATGENIIPSLNRTRKPREKKP